MATWNFNHIRGQGLIEVKTECWGVYDGYNKRETLKEAVAWKKVKAVEASAVRKGIPLTVGHTFVLVADNDEKDDDLGLYMVEGRRSSQAAADIVASFHVANGRLKKRFADPKKLLNVEALNARNSGFVERGGPFDDLWAFMQFLQRENVALRSEYGAKKAARIEGFAGVNFTPGGDGCQ